LSFVARGCPIPRQDWRWIIETDLAVWVGGRDKVATHISGNWITTSLELSPLAGGYRPRTVFADEQGRWWFDGPTGYAIYQGKVVQLQSDRFDLGEIPRPFTSLALPFVSNVPVKELLLRCRINDAPWFVLADRAEVEMGILEAGTYRVSIEAYGKRELARSNRLTYQFRVSYDVTREIDRLIADLGAAKFKVRQVADNELRRYGERARTALQTAARSPDPEVAERARRVLAVQPPKSTSDPLSK